jgi:formate dehydrogenase subunit delta
MKDTDMVRMANQIAAYFTAYPQDEAEAEVATHIRSFWEPRMRARLRDYLAKGGESLHPLVIAAMGRPELAHDAAGTGVRSA